MFIDSELPTKQQAPSGAECWFSQFYFRLTESRDSSHVAPMELNVCVIALTTNITLLTELGPLDLGHLVY